VLLKEGPGLAIARHLVELHGGAIEAHSEGRERGATFVVRFPAAAPLSSSRPAASQQPQWIPLEGVRVLIVDDEADTREMLAEALSASGASVLPAGSAKETLVLLRQHDADVLVSDIGMPEVDGYMLVRRVRALPGPAGRIAAVALTAYGRPRDGQNAIDAGFQAYLTTPVDLEALQEAVALLARRRLLEADMPGSDCGLDAFVVVSQRDRRKLRSAARSASESARNRSRAPAPSPPCRVIASSIDLARPS
jgi:CheY-like chemotaxis protein